MGAKFSSIELEIYSDVDLVELSKALELQIGTNYCGKTPDGQPWAYFYAGSYAGRFDDDRGSKRVRSGDPFEQGIDDSAIRLCDLIDNLAPKAKEIWNSANEKIFDIGLDANLDRKVIIKLLSPATMKRMSELGVRLAVSVYTIDIENEVHGLRKDRKQLLKLQKQKDG